MYVYAYMCKDSHFRSQYRQVPLRSLPHTFMNKYTNKMYFPLSSLSTLLISKNIRWFNDTL